MRNTSGCRARLHMFPKLIPRFRTINRNVHCHTGHRNSPRVSVRKTHQTHQTRPHLFTTYSQRSVRTQSPEHGRVHTYDPASPTSSPQHLSILHNEYPTMHPLLASANHQQRGEESQTPLCIGSVAKSMKSLIQLGRVKLSCHYTTTQGPLQKHQAQLSGHHLQRTHSTRTIPSAAAVSNMRC